MENDAQPTLLITTSILDSFGWLERCPPSWRERAYKSLVATIRREKYTPHKTAKRGVDFERAVYENAGSGGSKHFREVADKVRGAKFQQVLKKNINVEGREVLLYGKVDALFPTRIVDIKTTENYRGNDKYMGGWQHTLYCYMSGLKEFDYLVALFEPYPRNTMIAVYEICYKAGSDEALLEEIQRGIWHFYEWLMVEELFYDYENIFSNPRRNR